MKQVKNENEWTEIVCILDRSGSMGHLAADTIGGFNAFVDRQKAVPGRARLTVVLFDDEYEVPLEHIDIVNAPLLDERSYYVRGSTALLDAVGKAVNSLRGRIQGQDPAERPSQVVVLVMTDGEENASREYDAIQIKALVEETQSEGWEYVFIGANIDAFGTAGEMSMRAGSATNIAHTTAGIYEGYGKMARAVSNLRAGRAKGDIETPLDEHETL